MKKYSVQLTVLVLFSALFASGMIIGMEKEVRSLPSDVQKIIASKTLRVILDEAEDKPEMLFEKQWRGPKSVMEIITSFSVLQEKGSMLDMIILLIENGADPNTKNYKGNTVLHLLILGLRNKAEEIRRGFFVTKEGVSAFGEYLDALKVKLEILTKLEVNLNAETAKGYTGAHEIIDFVVLKAHLERCFDCKGMTEILWNFIYWLKKLGMDFTTFKAIAVKGKGKMTACQLGQYLINKKGMEGDFQKKLNDFQNKLKGLCSQK